MDPLPDPTPLSTFLRNKGLENNRTLFVTMASEYYINSIINFKIALDKWNLGKEYVVLCLDIECVRASEAHEVIAYDGYIRYRNETNGDWHLPVARMKVHTTLHLLC